MVHLRTVGWRGGDGPAGYPFDGAAVRALREGPLALPTAVTFFVGENGNGKSTLLEGIAYAAALPTIGSHDSGRDPTLAAGRRLAAALQLTWRARTRTGLFLRAEDFFGFARKMDEVRADLDAERRAIAEDATLSDLARGLGQMAYARELGEMERRYGAGADARSHGEAFLRLFGDAFRPGGLYLLDEPEAPLSPTRQLALLALLAELAQADGQFVIATHSPLLLALPGTTILSFDGGGAPHPVAWADLAHVTLTRAFLTDPAAFLRHLINLED